MQVQLDGDPILPSSHVGVDLEILGMEGTIRLRASRKRSLSDKNTTEIANDLDEFRPDPDGDGIASPSSSSSGDECDDV